MAAPRPFSFHPNGAEVVFQRNLGAGNNEIFRMNIDSSNQVNLTKNPASDASPDRAPDGRRIAFRSNRSGDTEVYTTNPDGSDVRLVIAVRAPTPSRGGTPPAPCSPSPTTSAAARG